jgi:hypothetical protein
MFLVHDDDLVEIDGLGDGRDAVSGLLIGGRTIFIVMSLYWQLLETHGSEVMMDHLRNCNIKIHNVSYGELPTLTSQL